MYQSITEEDKQRLSQLADFIEGFNMTAGDMWIYKKNSSVILKTDLAALLLFRQILEMGDAISILIRTGCINASKPLVRSLLEYYFQLTYLLKDDEERKALQFLYHYEMRLKEYYGNLAFPQKGGSYFEKLKNDKHLKDEDISDEQKKIYSENVKKIEAVLNGDENKLISKEYLRIENKKQNPKTGKKGKYHIGMSFLMDQQVLKGSVQLKEAALYQFIYRSCSSYSHGEDIVHANLESNNEDTFIVSPLRDLRQLSIVGNNILLLIELSCLIFLKKKIGDKKLFAEKLLALVKEKKMYTSRSKN